MGLFEAVKGLPVYLVVFGRGMINKTYRFVRTYENIYFVSCGTREDLAASKIDLRVVAVIRQQF